jgi:hypothetical protein
MEDAYSKRDFLKIFSSGLVATLLTGNPFAFASSDRKIKEKLYHEPLDVLLARMIFGEGRSVSTSEKITIGFTPINRAKDNKSYTGRTVREAILKTAPKEVTDENGKKKTVLFHKYSCFDSKNPNLKKLMNPLAYDYKEWRKCLRLSKNIIKGIYNRWNYGPTHYLEKKLHPKPSWARKMKKLDSTGFKHQFYRD